MGSVQAFVVAPRICALSSKPLRIMDGIRAAGGSVTDAADQLQRLGICVHSMGTHEA